MKNKKILSLILSVCLILGQVVTVSAASPKTKNSIPIYEVINGQEILSNKSDEFYFNLLNEKIGTEITDTTNIICRFIPSEGGSYRLDEEYRQVITEQNVGEAVSIAIGTLASATAGKLMAAGVKITLGDAVWSVIATKATTWLGRKIMDGPNFVGTYHYATYSNYHQEYVVHEVITFYNGTIDKKDVVEFKEPMKVYDYVLEGYGGDIITLQEAWAE